jgi:C4-dicarboxylate transporter, DctM subunit
VTAATVDNVSLPELKALRYPEDKAIGTLGFLIPPSILLIVYGATAEQSIYRLFIGGILPGLLVVTLFMGYLMIWTLINRGSLPSPPPPLPWRRRIAEARRLIPVLLLVAGVIGSIYAGIATPTEAAAIGVLGALLISLATARSIGRPSSRACSAPPAPLA